MAPCRKCEDEAVHGSDLCRSHMKKRDKRIRYLRHEEGLTLEEIGKRVHLTRERVRQVVPESTEIARESRYQPVREEAQRSLDNIRDLTDKYGVSPRTVSEMRDMSLRELSLTRFWFNVNVKSEDECWEWLLCYHQAGWPKTNLRPWLLGSTYTNARVHAYAMVYGRPPEGKWVVPICDNDRCVNPNHLEALDPGEALRIRRGG